MSPVELSGSIVQTCGHSIQLSAVDEKPVSVLQSKQEVNEFSTEQMSVQLINAVC